MAEGKGVITIAIAAGLLGGGGEIKKQIGKTKSHASSGKGIPATSSSRTKRAKKEITPETLG